MMDSRIRLPEGFQLKSSGRAYRIEHYISAGSNSIVYMASYEDTLMPEHVHTVLIKELYPLEPGREITRDSHMALVVPEEARGTFEYHKDSFLLGNQAHLSLASDAGGHIAENLDSFEANGTFYTVLTARKGQVLADLRRGGWDYGNVTDVVLCIRSLLHALRPFHAHNLLHLDISPDNIFLLAPAEVGKAPVDVLLLDFNSVYSMDRKVENACQYYLGKQAYMAPEVALHQKGRLGPWTDLYSVCVVFYELLRGEPLSVDRELPGGTAPISAYSRLLLHEKEQTAEKVNRILQKGLEILPERRYRSVEELLTDVEELLGILNGSVRLPLAPSPQAEPAGTGSFRKRGVRAAAALLALAVVGGGCYTAGRLRYRPAAQPPKLDLTKYPLERDDSVVLRTRNIRHRMEDNIMTMQVNTESGVEVMLQDWDHPRDPSEVFEEFQVFCFYNGRQDKRGWLFGDLTYDFFYTKDNTIHMVLPFQDESDFPLEYVGLAFQNFNYDNTSCILDVTRFTIVDGEGRSYEMTDMLGSYLLFFDEAYWQMNMMTTQNQDYLESFRQIYGGEMIVDAAVCFLDPVLEVTFESDDPKTVTVNERGRLFANRQGTATITVTVKDKGSGQTRRTQMLVYVEQRLV